MAPKRAKKVSKEEVRRDRLVELYARWSAFYHARRRLVLSLAGAVLGLALAVAGAIAYLNHQDQQANEALGRVVLWFESGQYQKALEGDTTQRIPGLAQIADRYRWTQTGKLAAYYAASAYYELGQYEKARQYFARYPNNGTLLAAAARAGEAAAYENAGQYRRAASLYLKAASQYKSELLTPDYLFGAARCLEQAGDLRAALRAYERVQKEFPKTPQASEAEQHVARLTAALASGS
ncbi:MAG: tetratricopeptide repeat protein [Bacteroidetes bacterium]|nr:tetratricopeptide repeat protein [Bacteroidota bacterium]MDW8138592.1 tetratricopeptide repeat protein [Bacteroidota bacterium]